MNENTERILADVFIRWHNSVLNLNDYVIANDFPKCYNEAAISF